MNIAISTTLYEHVCKIISQMRPQNQQKRIYITKPTPKKIDDTLY